MNKKGQAAMEFLMTYGWAILVVIAAIAALAYFGVLDPAKLLPERCQSSAGMDCIDYATVQPTQIDFTLRNNLAFDIVVYELELTTTCTTEQAAAGVDGAYVTITGGVSNVTVNNNQIVKIRYSGCSGLTAESKFDDSAVVWYQNTESGQPHPVSVDIRGRVV